jgi:ribosomal protein S18 acetylase RimI-like enzyme
MARDFDVIWKATTQTVWDDLPANERLRLDRRAFEAHFRPHAKKIMDSEGTETFVAEDGAGGVVGYTILGSATSMFSPTGFGFVYDLWVAEEARRQGVARALIEHATAWCRAHGLTSLKLEVAAHNAGARTLYAGTGFEEERVSMGRYL